MHDPSIDQSEKTKTIILILFADDLGSGDLGMHGGISRTPNIDRFATEGVELKRYYGYPLCSPSRAALLTGQMPRRYGITHALGPRDPGLPADLPTLPRTLQSFCYQTWLVGKWQANLGPCFSACFVMYCLESWAICQERGRKLRALVLASMVRFRFFFKNNIDFLWIGLWETC